MEILTIPSSILRTKCEPVTPAEFSTMTELAKDMIMTAQGADLIGIGANQVGVLQRIFVAGIKKKKNGRVKEINWFAFINPQVTPNENAGTEWDFEGCGSIPNMEYKLERWKKITIRAQDVTGQWFTKELTGENSRVCLHEIDHLNGVLLPDKNFREMRAKNNG